ncbi:MAG: DUF4432 family protein [Conexibacter sp.]
MQSPANAPLDGVVNLDHVASAIPSLVTDGPAAGCRALDLRVWGGIDVRVLPDRGFDVGAAWFAGVPLSWTSTVGEAAPLPAPQGHEWLDAFGGGLVTTCGLQNVGEPSEGHPMHGAISHRRAQDVRVERRRTTDGHVELAAAARVFDGSSLDGGLVLERTLRTRTGEGLLELQDVVSNPTARPLDAPLLYHLNVGAPVWSEGATLAIDSDEVVSEPGSPQRPLAEWLRPLRTQDGPERVGEHRLNVGADGWGSATIASPATGIELELRWEAAGLPRVHQWMHPAPHVQALAIEPANCLGAGRAPDRAEGRLPQLAPGERRTTRVKIRARRGTGAGA